MMSQECWFLLVFIGESCPWKWHIGALDVRVYVSEQVIKILILMMVYHF